MSEKLKEVAERMQGEVSRGARPTPERVVEVREFLMWFGNRRRTKRIVTSIRNRLEALGLRTVPDFEYTYIGASIAIILESEGVLASLGVSDDPTVHIGSLEAANLEVADKDETSRKLTKVGPDEGISVATTLMQMNDYSQLPVMVNQRDVKGIISWKSIGSRLVLGQECRHVRDCMDPAEVIDSKTPLLDAIRNISENGYVLVRGETQAITGIVTVSDVAEQFMQLAGPFLVIGEIEGHLRRLVQGKFTVEELRESSLSHDDEQPITGSADLTFGDYCHLLQNPKRWEQLKLNVDRKGFIDRLDSVRKIRNDVMHFDPEGLAPEDTKLLEDVARFFRGLVRLGAI